MSVVKRENDKSYTEKTNVWYKARFARIIDNAKYTGSNEYDAIIDEETFESAVSTKTARRQTRSKRNAMALQSCETESGAKTVAHQAKQSDQTEPPMKLTYCKEIISQRKIDSNTYDDAIVRQMIECIEVVKGGMLLIHLGGGYET